MKIIQLKVPVDAAELKDYLQVRVKPLFEKQRQKSLDFTYLLQGDNIEIADPVLYEGFLFRIEVNGAEIHIIKSEHYTDDVNVLTLEDIINNVMMDYPGRGDINYIGEES